MVLGKSQEAASRNLKLLEGFMAEHRDVLGWIPPRGGMTAFPWLVSGENERPFCQAATEHGILLAPGDCFDVPSHFRLGFAAALGKSHAPSTMRWSRSAPVPRAFSAFL